MQQENSNETHNLVILCKMRAKRMFFCSFLEGGRTRSLHDGEGQVIRKYDRREANHTIRVRRIDSNFKIVHMRLCSSDGLTFN